MARGQQAPPQANRANHQGLVPTPPPQRGHNLRCGVDNGASRFVGLKGLRKPSGAEHSGNAVQPNPTQVERRGHVCPARARHPTQCSGHRSRCFTPETCLPPSSPDTLCTTDTTKRECGRTEKVFAHNRNPCPVRPENPIQRCLQTVGGGTLIRLHRGRRAFNWGGGGGGDLLFLSYELRI